MLTELRMMVRAAASGWLLVLCLGSVGCGQSGVFEFPGCAATGGPLWVKAVRTEELSAARLTTMRLEAGVQSWVRRFIDRENLFESELRIVAPRAVGSYTCGDHSQPCQAELRSVTRGPLPRALALEGRLTLDQQNRLSAEFLGRGDPQRTGACSEIRLTLEGVRLGTH